MGQFTYRLRDEWVKVRDKVATDDTSTIGATTANWDNFPSARGMSVPQNAVGIVLALIGDHLTNPENGTATLTVWGYAERGPAHFICSAVWTIGATTVVKEPFMNGAASATEKYADTIGAITQRWLHQANAFNNEGNNEIAMLRIDAGPVVKIVVEVTGLSVGLSVTPIMTYYT